VACRGGAYATDSKNRQRTAGSTPQANPRCALQSRDRSNGHYLFTRIPRVVTGSKSNAPTVAGIDLRTKVAIFPIAANQKTTRPLPTENDLDRCRADRGRSDLGLEAGAGFFLVVLT
jgi:hypothetical protein